MKMTYQVFNDWRSQIATLSVATEGEEKGWEQRLWLGGEGLWETQDEWRTKRAI